MIVSESQRVQAYADMLARQQPIDDARERMPTAMNTEYTYHDGFTLRLHEGNTETWVELLGPDGQRVRNPDGTGAIVATMDDKQPKWADPHAHQLQNAIYIQATLHQPRTGIELATIRDRTEQAYNLVTQKSGVARRPDRARQAERSP